MTLPLTPFNKACPSEHLPCRSSQVFQEFATGQLGIDLVQAYVNTLVEFSSLQQPSFADSFFKLVLEQMTEGWRRFHHEQQCFPYPLFKLTSLSATDCLKEYRILQESARQCPQCFDLEFSTILLSYIPAGDAHANAKIVEVQNFLSNVMIYCPISSDLVECLHGSCQSKLHRFRGTRPTDNISKDIVVLEKITSAYSKFKDWMERQLGDRKMLYRLHSYGQHKGNQYTRWTDDRRAKCQGNYGMKVEDLDAQLANGISPRAPRKLAGPSGCI